MALVPCGIKKKVIIKVPREYYDLFLETIKAEGDYGSTRGCGWTKRNSYYTVIDEEGKECLTDFSWADASVRLYESGRLEIEGHDNPKERYFFDYVHFGRETKIIIRFHGKRVRVYMLREDGKERELFATDADYSIEEINCNCPCYFHDSARLLRLLGGKIDLSTALGCICGDSHVVFLKFRYHVIWDNVMKTLSVVDIIPLSALNNADQSSSVAHLINERHVAEAVRRDYQRLYELLERIRETLERKAESKPGCRL